MSQLTEPIKLHIVNQVISISPFPYGDDRRMIWQVEIHAHLDNKYLVTDGWSPRKYCDAKGNWDYRREDAEGYNDDEWLKNHAFDKEFALELAAHQVKTMVRNGKTYKDVL